MTASVPITIGLPVYNGEPYLAESLESILGQTYGDLVVVISDNASTDRTEEIVRSYAARDDRVQYLRAAENHGAAWNYNRVFAECRSPYFKWAASDDVLAPTCVERCFEVMHAAPSTVVLVYPQTRFIGPDGEVIRDVEDGLDVREATPHERLRHVVENAVWGNVAFGLVRSDALRRTRGHGSYPSADLVLYAELALLGQFWEVPERLFLRRFHEAMSRQAHVGTGDLAQWMDPSSKGGENELRRVFFEHFGAIRHAPLSTSERFRCYVTFVPTWMRRHVPIPMWLYRPLSRLNRLVRRHGR
jgi:glycosyltransferase involved in cell wall biosynthesis